MFSYGEGGVLSLVYDWNENDHDRDRDNKAPSTTQLWEYISAWEISYS